MLDQNEMKPNKNQKDENQEQEVGIMAPTPCCSDCIIVDPANGCSVREGIGTTASGVASHAEGFQTIASNLASHAEGESTIASDIRAHAEGAFTIASGVASHAEGQATIASGNTSHAEGFRTIASGDSAHAEGRDFGLKQTQAIGDASHAEGQGTTANGVASHTEGRNTTTGVNALAAHAEGLDTTASGEASHAEGRNTTAGGLSSHAEGRNTVANETASHAEGRNTTASGEASHAEGGFTTASGAFSHAEGDGTTADVTSAHAEGQGTLAHSTASHAEGISTTASGEASHSEGFHTNASGNDSHAEGSFTIASGFASHAEGDNTTANGRFSHAEGTFTSTNIFDGAHIMGKFGDADESYSWFLANGTSVLNKGLAAKISTAGFGVSDRGWRGGGADYAEMFETVDEKPIDIGYFVTLEGKKIRKANATDDYILGIVSADPAILADSGELRWKDKYVTDEWNRVQYHDVVIPAEKDKDGNVIVPERTEKQPILNPNWDPTKEYIPRSERPEWVEVGLLGKLRVRDDGTCQMNGYCKPNDEGIAMASDKGYRVMERTGPNQILVLFK
ncbi:peptidase G2 autoproteolytic cleavage domain-containing protein [Peribacillus butanolivorans]|uniref:peptidase G2 autoproteolytic cleavage domain-containing protein n=1 Tax=Peribacillus butanolivorans TaxID=421767 RepID=UPI003663AE2C